MNAIVDEGAPARAQEGSAASPEAADAPRRWRSATGREVRDLMLDVQDLLGRVAHIKDPDFARLKAQIEGRLATARSTVMHESERLQRRVEDAFNAGDDYVRQRPWQAIGAATAAGLVVGFLAARRLRPGIQAPQARGSSA